MRDIMLILGDCSKSTETVPTNIIIAEDTLIEPCNAVPHYESETTTEVHLVPVDQQIEDGTIGIEEVVEEIIPPTQVPYSIGRTKKHPDNKIAEDGNPNSNKDLEYVLNPISPNRRKATLRSSISQAN